MISITSIHRHWFCSILILGVCLLSGLVEGNMVQACFTFICFTTINQGSRGGYGAISQSWLYCIRIYDAYQDVYFHRVLYVVRVDEIVFYMLSGLMRSCSNTFHSRFVLVGSAWYIVLIFSVAFFVFVCFHCVFFPVLPVSGFFILDCHFDVL